jgi:hypothetical protein
MTRNLKALALAVGAVLSMSAVLASAAQAETGALTTTQYPAIVTGEQQGGVTFDFGEAPIRTATCASKLDGTLANGPGDPVTFVPTYNNCVSEPGGATPVTITMNGCDYVIGFSRPGTTGQAVPTGLMQAWVNCPAGQQIEIHVYENAFMHAINMSTCTYDIKPQGPVAAGIYHNTNAGIPDVDATVNAKFTGTSTIGAGGAICGGNPMNQGHLPITLTGNYTLRSFQDFDNGVEGAQLPLDVG